MFYIRYGTGWIDEYVSEEAWNDEIEDIAENTPFDIDIDGNVAYIDDGDE